MEIKRKQLLTALNQFYTKPIARVSVELLLTLCTVLFFALFAIRPTLLTMSDLIKEIDDKKALDQQLSQKIAALSSAQTEYLRLEGRLNVLDEALPSQPKIIEAVKIIEKIASDRNIAILSLNVAELPVENGSSLEFDQLTRQQTSASVTITGDYLTIRQFVEDLKATRRSFIVDTVIFSLSEESGQKSLKATVTINIPYFGTKS